MISFSKRLICILSVLMLTPFVFGQDCHVLVFVKQLRTKQPMEKVLVTLCEEDSVYASTFTDSKGKAEFEFFPDSSKRYSIKCRKEGEFPPPSAPFKPSMREGKYNQLVLEIAFPPVIAEADPIHVTFSGNNTKRISNADMQLFIDLLREYPEMCLGVNYAKRTNEKKRLQRKRTRTFKKRMKEHEIDLNRIVFSKETFENESLCQGCFLGVVLRMDGCK